MMKGYVIYNRRTSYFKYGVHWERNYAQLFKRLYEAEEDLKLLNMGVDLIIVEFSSKNFTFNGFPKDTS